MIYKNNNKSYLISNQKEKVTTWNK